MVLGARYEDAKERCMEAYKEEKIKVKRCIYESKKEVNEKFARKMNQDVDGNRKLFWKEVSKDGNGRLAMGEVEVQRIWNKLFS